MYANQKKYLCLFGVGQILEATFTQMVSMLGRKPDFVCDNNPEKWGKCFGGIVCISPNELASYSGDVHVIITIRKFEAVVPQLHNVGITDLSIAVFNPAYFALSKICSLENMSVIQPEKLPLAGRWAFVTGASRGIGFQIATALAKEGVNLIVHSRSHLHNREVIIACEKAGVDVVSMQSDLAVPAQIHDMLNQLDKLPIRIEIVYNCAGISLPKTDGVWDVDAETYKTTYMVNVIAPIMISNHLIPKMLSSGFGRIVNVSSSIQNSLPEMAYACSKAALNKYTHDILPSLEGQGVLMSLLDPGWLQTDMGGELAPHSAESVLPGALLGTILADFKNGRWFNAQDYVGLSIEKAVEKAIFLEA